MTRDSDQQGADAMGSSWPSPTGAAADPPVAAGGAMTVGGILTVAGILLLFVAFALGLVSLQYCFNMLDREGAHQQQQASPSGRRRRRGSGASVAGDGTTGGVDPEVLRSLPVTVVCRPAPGPKVEAAAAECAVCLAELEDGEEARFLPRCGHGFHAECVDAWLASHSTCPLCRLTVAKPDEPPAPASPLPPVPPPEPANLPASALLLGLSGRGAVTAGAPSASTGTTAFLVIEIPELAVPTPPTPRDAAKSPGSARLRSMRRLWSFGRQGAGPSSSCSREEADVEQGVSVTIGSAVAEAQRPSEAASGATPGSAP